MFFSLISSFGISLHRNSSVEILPFSGSQKEKRLVLAALVTGNEYLLEDDLKQKYRSLLSELDAEGAIFQTYRPTTKKILFDNSTPITNHSVISVLSRKTDLQILDLCVEFQGQFGLKLEERETNHNSPSSQPFPIHIIEITNDQGDVIGEGKGETKEQAMVGAMGEAMERISLNSIPPERLIIDCAKNLKKMGLIIPETDVGQYDSFSADLFTDWVIGENISGLPTVLPADLVCYNRDPEGLSKSFVSQTTMGVACGVTKDFAKLRAAIELMQTDAYALHARLGIYNEELVLSNFEEDKFIAETLNKLQQLDLTVSAFNIQFDHPIPVVHCILVSPSDQLPALSHGLGSGFSILEAFRTALIEAMQVYSDLVKVTEIFLEECILASEQTKTPEFYWSDPANKKTTLAELSRFKVPVDISLKDNNLNDVISCSDFLIQLQASIGEISFYQLKAPVEGCYVYRAYAERTTALHDFTKENENRLNSFKNKYSIDRETGIPILT